MNHALDAAFVVPLFVCGFAWHLLFRLKREPFLSWCSASAKMVFWEGWISDELMGTFSPIVVYWLYAGMYQLLPPLDQYRLHTRKEEEQKNLVPLSSVIKGVLLQQLVQATVAGLMFLVSSSKSLNNGY